MSNMALNFVMPPRTLFQLVPRGIGTWERQRLSSYIQELAATSFVRPRSLRDRYGAYPYGRMRITGKPGAVSAFYSVNGSGAVATNWVGALAPLVGRDDLACLTLLPFARFIRANEGAFVHRRRRWCARCLNCDVEAGRMPYERLLWAVKEVVVCPLHEIPLVDCCIRCGRSQSTELARDCLPGHCGHCQAWLGVDTDRQRDIDDPIQFAHSLWVARDFANLLDMSDYELAHATIDNVIRMLRWGIEVACDGEKRVLAEHAKISAFAIKNWLNGSRDPSFTSICRLAWVFGVPTRACLTGQFDASEFRLPQDRVPYSQRKSAADRPDWERVAARLRASAIEGGPYRSVRGAAKGEDIKSETLKLHLPNEYKLLRDSGRRSRHEACLARRRSLHAAVRAIIVQLSASDTYPSARKVKQLLLQTGKRFDLYAVGRIYHEERKLLKDAAVAIAFEPVSGRRVDDADGRP